MDNGKRVTVKLTIESDRVTGFEVIDFNSLKIDDVFMLLQRDENGAPEVVIHNDCNTFRCMTLPAMTKDDVLGVDADDYGTCSQEDLMAIISHVYMNKNGENYVMMRSGMIKL